MRNLTMMTDLYQLTMMNGYLEKGMGDTVAVFDVFFRTIPDNGGFAIFAGLEQLIDYLKNLNFTEDDIEYLRTKKIFDEEFLSYLKTFRFTGDIWAVPEGTPIIVRTMEGDTDVFRVAQEDYIMIGVDGEVYPIKEAKFKSSYEESDREYCFEKDVVDAQYVPNIRNCLTGENTPISAYAKTCIPTGQVRIYAKPVDTNVKVFTLWGKYYLGKKRLEEEFANEPEIFSL